MVSPETVTELALSLHGVVKHEHWGRPAFKVNKKIFATIWPAEKRAVLLLTVVQQSVYTEMNNKIFFAVKGGWGSKGATNVDLSAVKKNVLKEALKLAWMNRAKK